MERILDRFSLGDILRHFISGAVFVVSALYSQYQNTEKVFRILSEHYLSLAIAAFVVGTLVYGIHRGTSNVLIEMVRHYLLTSQKLRRWAFPKRCKDFMFARWNHRKLAESNEAAQIRVISQHILAWADYAHLLYTSGLAVWLGSASIVFHYGYSGVIFDWRTFFIGFGLMFFGLINDFRKQIAEEQIYNLSEN